MNFADREQLLTKTFTPRSPVNQRALFSGRIEQLAKVQQAASSPGTHAILFGERGVGKTSLANVAEQIIPLSKGNCIAVKVTCNSNDTYSSVWRRAFAAIKFPTETKGIGFDSSSKKGSIDLASTLPDVLVVDDVERTLKMLSNVGSILLIFDEFDRLRQTSYKLTIPFSDTIKVLSDNALDVTILIVGVADSIDTLIEGHESVERAIVQIPMPRMSKVEIGQIIDNGTKLLDMKVDATALEQIMKLSQGLPYITHLISLHSFGDSIANESRVVTVDNVRSGIESALSEWQESIKRDYVRAVSSTQKKNIFKEVLLACAMAETDEIGYYAAADVRTPLREMTGQLYDIPNFARHLKEFSSQGRGEIIERTGQSKRLRYRFNNPLMRTYVVIRGVSEGMVSLDNIR